ncbi:MAG: hypothetical protein WC707_06920 [Candidatus Babeliaceae bacterium]|jgi:hypothetical protein
MKRTNILNVIAIIVIIGYLAFTALLFFFEIPEKNAELLKTIYQSTIAPVFLSVIYFFFGSSKGSRDKQSSN